MQNIKTNKAVRPATESGDWALLVDGTALFFGQRAVSPDKSLDYAQLEKLLTKRIGYGTPPKTAIFFTAADDSNEKQKKFHEMLVAKLGWQLKHVPVHEATVVNPLLSEGGPKYIRFDSMISYSMGRLAAGQRPVSRIAVVSDSWPLFGPATDCALRGVGVTMVFFGETIDIRWNKVFRKTLAEGEPLDFLDLEAFHDELFSRPRPTMTRDARLLDID